MTRCLVAAGTLLRAATHNRRCGKRACRLLRRLRASRRAQRWRGAALTYLALAWEEEEDRREEEDHLQAAPCLYLEDMVPAQPACLPDLPLASTRCLTCLLPATAPPPSSLFSVPPCQPAPPTTPAITLPRLSPQLLPYTASSLSWLYVPLDMG